MNTLNLFHIIFREVVHTTEWIADSLNSPQGCTSGTNASDSQQELLSTCTKRRHRGSSTMWSIFGEKSRLHSSTGLGCDRLDYDEFAIPGLVFPHHDFLPRRWSQSIDVGNSCFYSPSMLFRIRAGDFHLD